MQRANFDGDLYQFKAHAVFAFGSVPKFICTGTFNFSAHEGIIE
jgi:hypothetical protein